MAEYVLKSVVALSATYLLYFVFARKNMNFKWLRAYFLIAILVSCTFPALKYMPVLHRPHLVSVSSTYIPHWMEEPSYDVVVTREISSPVALAQTSKSKLLLTDVLKYAYVTGFLLILLRFIVGLSQLVWLTVTNRVRRLDKDRLVFVKNLSTPFSFFQLIFIDENDLHDKRKTCMLYHERVHVRQWHSVDLLLLEFITMVQWFNPFAWLIRKALKEIHEYLADEETVKGDVSPLDYQHLLLVQACGLKAYLPVNGFKNSLTKKRILMITNNKRNRKWVAIVLLLVTVIVIVDSFTRIGILRAASNGSVPMITRALNISNSSTKEDKPLDTGKAVIENTVTGNLDTLKTNVISHKITVKDTNVKLAPFIYGGESRIHLIRNKEIEYGFIGKIREFKRKNPKGADSITSIMCIDGGGVMGNFKDQNVTVAYNSFISAQGLNVIFPNGYEDSKKIVLFLRNAINNPRITEAVKKMDYAHFQVGLSINKLGQITKSFLSTSSDSHEMDNEFVKMFRSAPFACTIEQNGDIVNETIIFLFAIYSNDKIKMEINTGKVQNEDSISGIILPTNKDLRTFEQFIKENWQIPPQWRDDTTTIVIKFKVQFDNDGKMVKITKGEPWKEINYCLHNNNLKVVEDSKTMEELSGITKFAPTFRFRRNNQYQQGNRCKESSFCLLIKMNTMSLHNYSWNYEKVNK